MVMSSKKRSSTAREGSHCPRGMEGKAVSVVEKERPVRGTHRSLEGLGYLGMLSAAPTDMGSSLL
ncbi:hypothetical protein CDC19_25380 [Pseudomonas aeruginosa]|nr:hypothetical protein CDC19_25380 [Pseudomonas aeruginosa]